ncbi:hypothetical protein BV97_04644 [Novosphingobium resinovorum]|uniref:Lipoprotein n=1 Tax=Novosphingobium resinovorum TaxID=158500 RepID=A0A031JKZ6_9SPHN|nr:hypothetical protein [Novosphingobium resinovorum]EZP74906.1 hypothetical protein BV97_04644 [Novosphingobium resinovorum]
MRYGLCFMAALSLTGCQQAPSVDPQDFNRLREKVSVLEADVATLKQQESPTTVEPINAKNETTAPAAGRYRLVGTAFRDEPDLRYATKAECEAAKQTLLDDWQVSDERDRQSGLVFRSRPTPSCLPL